MVLLQPTPSCTHLFIDQFEYSTVPWYLWSYETSLQGPLSSSTRHLEKTEATTSSNKKLIQQLKQWLKSWLTTMQQKGSIPKVPCLANHNLKTIMFKLGFPKGLQQFFIHFLKLDERKLARSFWRHVSIHGQQNHNCICTLHSYTHTRRRIFICLHLTFHYGGIRRKTNPN